MGVALLPALAVAIWMGGSAAAGSVVEWTRQFGSTSSDRAHGVAVTSDGGVVVAGWVDGELPGGGGALGSTDLFVRRYDADGTVMWSRQIGTCDGANCLFSDSAEGLAIGPDGRIHLAAMLGREAGVVVLGGDGVGWEYRFVDAEPSIEINTAFAVDVDTVGNTLLAGRAGFGRAITGGGGTAGSVDAFVVKYDPTGGLLWARQFGSNTVDEAFGIAVDLDHKVYVVGSTQGVLSDGGGSAGDVDAFIRKYDEFGALAWTRQFGTGGRDEAFGVAVGGDGSVYVVGQVGGELAGGGGQISTRDAFVRKYDAAGTSVWTRQFGTPGLDIAYGVTVGGDDGGVYVVGRVHGALPEGGGAIGAFDAFVRKYHPDGTVMWTRQFGTNTDDEAHAVGIGGTRVAIVGHVGGELADGGGSSGGEDVFVRVYQVDFDTDGDGFPDDLDNFPLTPSSCRGQQATIIGTEGPDVIHGTEGPDVIMGFGGDDIIYGNGGDDLICAGSGRDTIYGGAGNDRIYGEKGRDRLYGETGNDRLFGGKGDDRLFGGRGHDRLFGGKGDDRLFGSRGNDRLFGGVAGLKLLDGGVGYDRCEAPGPGDFTRCEEVNGVPVIGP